MVFTPLATNRAFRWAASYRSRSLPAKAGNGNAGGEKRDSRAASGRSGSVIVAQWKRPQSHAQNALPRDFVYQRSL
jgi:hypothetical protein